MRESPWRSPARPLLAALALAASACVPQVNLRDRPPPCGDGYSQCDSSGSCKPIDPSNPDGPPLDCPTGPFTVRQGGDLDFAAPGAREQDISVEGIKDDPVTAAAFTKPDGTVVVRVHSAHGSPPSDFPGGHRVFKITTKLGDNTPFVRLVPVIVSFIYAAPHDTLKKPDPKNPPPPLGNNDNYGVLEAPFETFQKAASVAGPGDTIILRNYGEQVSGPGSNSMPLDKPLASGVTVECLDPPSTVVMNMPLSLGGAATLRNLELDQRFVISAPGDVQLDQVKVLKGITISHEASAASGAPGATLELTNGTLVSSGDLPPLLVQADGATAKLASNTTGINMVGFDPSVETIRFEGARQSLEIHDAAHVQNSASGALAIHVIGSANLLVDGGARFISPITIEGSGSTATFQNVSFGSAPLTFQGDALKLLSNTNFSDSLITFRGRMLTIFDTQIVGQGIEQQKMSDAVPGDAVLGSTTLSNAHYTFGAGTLTIQDQTSFTDTPLTFQGKSLSITDAVFSGQGIEQLSESTSALNNVIVTGYTNFGYHLQMGKVDIEGGSFSHDKSVLPSADGQSPPWAVWVNAPGDTDSSVESHGTLFDGSPPPVEVCMCIGPKSCNTVLSVTTDVPVSICQ
jgi:hypothetical protein